MLNNSHPAENYVALVTGLVIGILELYINPLGSLSLGSRVNLGYGLQLTLRVNLIGSTLVAELEL